MRFALVVLLFTFFAGCNHQASLAEWCEKTARCTCTSEACCVLKGSACTEDTPCCDGSSCVSMRCQAVVDAGQ